MDEAREDHIGRNAVAAVDRERDRNGTQTSSKLQAVEGLAGLAGRVERVQSCAASRSVVIYFCASRTSAMRTRRELMSARNATKPAAPTLD